MKTFWYILTMSAVLWYSFVTAYVAVKGVGDIKGMLARLAKKQKENR
jgi:hypothetical protein